MKCAQLRRVFLCLVIPAVACLAGAAHGQAHAQGTIGVILLHGKQSTPRTPGMIDIASKLERGGAKVVVPLMPWGEREWERISVTVEDVFAQIDGHVAKLRAQGAQRIVVGGQSLGANMGLAYAVARPNVAGVVMVAPGHNPGRSYRVTPAIREAIDRAGELTRSGQGGQSFRGGDDNQGSTLTLSTTAAVYISWMSPRGRASMNVQAPLLPANVPILLVIGNRDPSFNFAEANIYRPAAKHPYSKYLVVNADHGGTASAASLQIAEWIKGLPAQ